MSGYEKETRHLWVLGRVDDEEQKRHEGVVPS